MKIIQITDLHLANEGEDTFGVDVRKNFLSVLKEAKSYAPDLLVLSGDICFDKGERSVYQWVKPHLDFMAMPYNLICGNHDDTEMLAEVFGIQHLLVTGELYYKRLFGKQPILFLETSSGEVSKKQLAWLDLEMGRLRGDAAVFMHHPPLIGGVPYMDNNYPLRNMEDVQKIMFGCGHHLSVFCGHYHVEKTLQKRNLTVHITPSTYFQIDCKTAQFKIDHYRPALREINLRKDGVVESTVVYFDGYKM